jgi:Zn-dependent metalloprotease
MKRNIVVSMMVFVLCCFLATNSWAAKKIDFTAGNAQNYIKQLNATQDRSGNAIGKALGLGQYEAFKLVRERMDFNNVIHQRYDQSFKGIPVWGTQTVVSVGPDGQVVRLHGSRIQDIKVDIASIPASLNPRKALLKMQEQHKKIDPGALWSFRNETYGTYIYIDEKGKANLCYVVSFFADTENGDPSRYIHFIDVKSGKIIHSFDALTYVNSGTGPGGNQKIGQYEYGTDYPSFCVTVNGSTCTMNCTNVKTVDLNHGTSGSTAYSYTCYRNTHESINGGYCPLNDGMYFGQVIYDMYQAWYGLPVLPFQLTMKLHYSTGYENAFWDGSSMTFGDGASTFYPLCCLDVSAHEVSHGFTENHSNLTYSGQSGGINESYSDMAGEAAKYYMRGTNDFMCGYDIFKAAGEALRYLYNPPLDGVSIDHVSEYYSGLDVHYSSGVYNKAFYLIATSSGWTTRMAFNIFTKANTDYWTAGETFQSAGQGVMDAAEDYGYSCTAVANGFAQVGVTVSCAGPPVANFTGSPTTVSVGGSVTFTDTSTGSPTSWSWTFAGGTPATSTVKNPVVTYSTLGTYTVTLVATNSFGSDTETKTNYITVSSVVYCASKGTSQADEWISRVRVRDLDHSSGASQYSDFTAYTANLTRGTAASVTLNTGYSGTIYTEYWRIWVDYNRDGDFADSGEQVFSKYGKTSVTGSFTPATSKTPGVTRMRVSMKYGGYPTSCQTFSYGEVEDYKANVI